MGELKSIHIQTHEGFDGSFVTTDKRCGTKENPHDSKFSIMLPVPRDEEECQLYYNCSLGHFIQKGIVQQAYDETSVTNLIKEKIANGEDPESEEFMEAVKESMEVEIMYDPEKRVRATGEKKALDQEIKSLKTDFGMSYSDIRKEIAELKKLKAEQAGE